jgi:hypothetical protein
MKIGLIIGRIGDVDGVGLETEKWIEVLKKMGHEIFILSGHFKKDVIEPENQTALRPFVSSPSFPPSANGSRVGRSSFHPMIPNGC